MIDTTTEKWASVTGMTSIYEVSTNGGFRRKPFMKTTRTGNETAYRARDLKLGGKSGSPAQTISGMGLAGKQVTMSVGAAMLRTFGHPQPKGYVAKKIDVTGPLTVDNLAWVRGAMRTKINVGSSMEAHIIKLRSECYSYTDISKETGVSATVVTRICKASR